MCQTRPEQVVDVNQTGPQISLNYSLVNQPEKKSLSSNHKQMSWKLAGQKVWDLEVS